MNETFDATCDQCGKSVRIDSVSEHHSGNRLKGYSYIFACRCGVRTSVAGCRIEHVPDAMKRAAKLRWRAYHARHCIDDERRELPACPVKAMLKESRLRLPEYLEDSNWIVYRLDEKRTVEYSTETGIYKLNSDSETTRFPEVNALVEHLAKIID